VPADVPAAVQCLPEGWRSRGETSTDTVAERVAGHDVDVSQGNDRVTINARDAQLQITREGEALPTPADFPPTCSSRRDWSFACRAC
jgi:chromosome condensin MukBEF MukE localization factor